MPRKLERKLRRKAEQKGLKGDAKRRYVYGTMRDQGWKPSKSRKKEKK